MIVVWHLQQNGPLFVFFDFHECQHFLDFTDFHECQHFWDFTYVVLVFLSWGLCCTLGNSTNSYSIHLFWFRFRKFDVLRFWMRGSFPLCTTSLISEIVFFNTLKSAWSALSFWLSTASGCLVALAVSISLSHFFSTRKRLQSNSPFCHWYHQGLLCWVWYSFHWQPQVKLWKFCSSAGMSNSHLLQKSLAFAIAMNLVLWPAIFRDSIKKRVWPAPLYSWLYSQKQGHKQKAHTRWATLIRKGYQLPQLATSDCSASHCCFLLRACLRRLDNRLGRLFWIIFVRTE